MPLNSLTKSPKRYIVSPLLWITLSFLGLSSTKVSAATLSLVIDDFLSQTQTAQVDEEAPATVSDTNTVTLPSFPLGSGTQRTLLVEKTQGDDGERFRTRINSSNSGLLSQTIDLALGRTLVTWSNLGGKDFTPYDTLNLKLFSSDLSGPVAFKFWDLSNNIAETTFNVLGSSNQVLLSKNFNAFTATGDTLGNILNNVSKIQLEIDATNPNQQGWDIAIDEVTVTGTQDTGNPNSPATIPEPSTVLGLLGLGNLYLAMSLRRRKQ